ncbi:MAG: dihydrodipicolinate synthase family protein [Candidatus Hydrogenedentes bacterium]|nr:dihydrodipicolinate synthase family protein [Candidatus Hydrogenedentota bacterium]
MANKTAFRSGIVPPLVTPLLDRDTIDVEGTKRLVEHVIRGGVSGIFILGTTGEAPSLSYRLRKSFIKLVCEHVGGRIPVYVGITDTSFVESVQMAKTAHESDATAVVLAAPYYFPEGQAELIQYVTHIVRELPIPLILYNMPSMTKVWFEIESLEKLAAFKNIIGIKDSSADLDYYKQLISLKRMRPDWSILMGPEHLLVESMRLGGDGGVNGGANIFPELFTSLYAACRAGDETKITKLQGFVEELQAIYTIGKYASRYLKATKTALYLRGICSDCLAEPFNHFLPPERKAVQEIIEPLTATLVDAGIIDA